MIKIQDLSTMPIPNPYLIAATDEYYGFSPSFQETKSLPNVNKTKNKKLRILITTFWDYPVIGGLQNYIYALKKGLEKLGHTVDIIAPNQFPRSTLIQLEQRILVETKQFYIKRYGCINDSIVKQNVRLTSYEMMLRGMNLEKYDIFHAQDRFTANILSRVNEHYKKPLLFTPHGFMTHRRIQFGQIEKGSVEAAYFLAMDKKAILSSNHLIILCEVFRPILKDLGLEESKMTTIYTGIDFSSEITEFTKGAPQDKTVITCISRLRPRKGHKHLLEALSLIKRELEQVEVWIVGDGEMREQLESQANALELDNVFFLGARSDIPELLSQSDIFILPTTSDTLPIAIIEAMLAEKPIITTNCGGIPEIIQHNFSGLITEQKNAQELSDSISLLLKDSIFGKKLAQNAKAFADQYLTSTNMVKEIEKTYLTFSITGGVQI